MSKPSGPEMLSAVMNTPSVEIGIDTRLCATADGAPEFSSAGTPLIEMRIELGGVGKSGASTTHVMTSPIVKLRSAVPSARAYPSASEKSIVTRAFAGSIPATPRFSTDPSISNRDPIATILSFASAGRSIAAEREVRARDDRHLERVGGDSDGLGGVFVHSSELDRERPEIRRRGSRHPPRRGDLAARAVTEAPSRADR